MVRVVFVRQFAHLATHLLRATGVIHVLAELLVSDEPVVDTQEIHPTVTKQVNSRKSCLEEVSQLLTFIRFP